ncbi:MAG: hypothetical protein JWO34_1185, partial [Arthrobacter sp.]|nr:hypothetical protein [Arthrobacter sp.]
SEFMNAEGMDDIDGARVSRGQADQLATGQGAAGNTAART